MIASTKAERIGYLDDPNVLPCVGNDAYIPNPQGELALPLEGCVLDFKFVCCFTVYTSFYISARNIVTLYSIVYNFCAGCLTKYSAIVYLPVTFESGNY